MRKFAAGFVAVILCFALAAAAQAQDRYERPVRYRDGGPPPPSYGAPPPPPRHAVHGEPYFFGHVGFFEPNDSSQGLQGYDSGGSFDFGMGSRVSPALAIEG